MPLTMAYVGGKAALELHWMHHATERSEEIRVFAMLFPMVCYVVRLSEVCGWCYRAD